MDQKKKIVNVAASGVFGEKGIRYNFMDVPGLPHYVKRVRWGAVNQMYQERVLINNFEQESEQHILTIDRNFDNELINI